MKYVKLIFSQFNLLAALSVLPRPALATSSNHFDILMQACDEARDQYRDQRPGSDPGDVRHIFRLDGLTWPTWEPMNPNDSLDLLNRTIGWGTGNPDHGKIYQEGIAYLQKAAKDGLVAAQRTYISFSTPSSEGPIRFLPDSAEIVRVRLRASKQVIDTYKKFPNLHWPYEDWAYGMVSDRYNRLINNTPIAFVSVLRGELAEIDDGIVIFGDGYFVELFVQVPPGIGNFNNTEATSISSDFQCVYELRSDARE